MSEKKPKDYKKLSRIRTVIFLLLAAAVLTGMYLKERPEKKNSEVPSGTQILRSVPESGEAGNEKDNP